MYLTSASSSWLFGSSTLDQVWQYISSLDLPEYFQLVSNTDFTYLGPSLCCIGRCCCWCCCGGAWGRPGCGCCGACGSRGCCWCCCCCICRAMSCCCSLGSPSLRPFICCTEKHLTEHLFKTYLYACCTSFHFTFFETNILLQTVFN